MGRELGRSRCRLRWKRLGGKEGWVGKVLEYNTLFKEVYGESLSQGCPSKEPTSTKNKHGSLSVPHLVTGGEECGLGEDTMVYQTIAMGPFRAPSVWVQLAERNHIVS